MKKKNHFNSGETLVEAMVGIFIFLIILAGHQCPEEERGSPETKYGNLP